MVMLKVIGLGTASTFDTQNYRYTSNNYFKYE